jgi:hypothetical protein
MRTPTYINAGETMNFSFTFLKYYGCGSCTNIQYSGFQIFGTPSLQTWLFSDSIEYEGEKYFLYPHREIK